MKKSFHTLIVLTTAVLFYGCRKEVPLLPPSNDPVFKATGTIGSTELNMQAGVNNYYMHSYYTSDVLDVYEYTGELKPRDCPFPCPNSMRVRIRDYAQHSVTASTVADSALQAGGYSFVTSPVNNWTVNFFGMAGGSDSIYSFLWLFGDNTTGGGQNPVHTYTNPGTYYISLTIVGQPSGCNFTTSDTLIIGSSSCSMYTDFQYQYLTPDSLQFFTPTVINGTAPFSYFWEFDTITSTLDSPSVYFYNSAVHSVRLRVTDANGCVAKVVKHLPTGSNTSCYSGFSYQAYATGSLDLSKVVVEWVDGNGNLYTSANPSQSGNSTFQIISVEEYGLNESGLRTKKIHMLVNCTLYNGTNSVQLQNADLIFALAYP